MILVVLHKLIQRKWEQKLTDKFVTEFLESSPLHVFWRGKKKKKKKENLSSCEYITLLFLYIYNSKSYMNHQDRRCLSKKLDVIVYDNTKLFLQINRLHKN